MKTKVLCRLHVVLIERQIKTGAAFARLMTDYGFNLSPSQANRYLSEINPPAMSLEFVEAACNVLQCLPGDLYDVVVYHDEGESIQHILELKPNIKTRVGLADSKKKGLTQRVLSEAKRVVSWENTFGVAGPTITPIT